MSFSGNIENFSVVDILQYLHANRSTGNLCCEKSSGDIVEIYFRNGQCIHASGTKIDNIGNVLTMLGFVSQEELSKAAQKQKSSKDRKPLGAILKEMNLITHDMIRKAVVHQIEESIYELIGWEDGTFNFEIRDTPIQDDISVAIGDLVLPEEANTIYMLLSAVRKFDEATRSKKTEHQENIVEPNAPREENRKVDRVDETREIDKEEHEPIQLQNFEFTFSLLKTMLMDFSQLERSEEIALQMLNVLSEHMERAVLFLVRGDKLRGMGGFGSCRDKESINIVSKRFQFPLSHSQVVRECIENRASFDGRIPQEFWFTHLHEKLGPPAYNQITIFPIRGVEQVMAVIYGDNGERQEPIHNLELLEMAAAQTGIIMENVFLRRLIKKWSVR